MKKSMIAVAVVLVVAGGYAAYQWATDSEAASTEQARADAGGRGRGRANAAGGGFPGGGGAGARLPMTIELAPVKRADMTEQMTVVGNLIGATTVETTPKVQGRLDTVSVRLGDRVTRGQRLAQLDDREILEQVKQAEASYQVAAATIRQREADLKFAQTNLDRSLNLFERQLIPKQTFDDAEARYQAANAQVDLAKALFSQAGARLDEL
jgi:multidrug resistance efflux pump